MRTSAIVVLLAAAASAVAAGPAIHGEGALFATPAVALAWGVLRAASDEDTQVVIRIAPGDGTLTHARVDAVDPFGGARRVVSPGGPLGAGLDVRAPRASFADFPRREIRLYAGAEAWRAGDAALTIYYVGVPDTTPELTTEAALRTYLADAVRRARAGQR